MMLPSAMLFAPQMMCAAAHMNTTIQGAELVAEEIRTKEEELKISDEKDKIGLTISLGVASVVPDNDMLPTELIDAADRALYKAKNVFGKIEVAQKGSKKLAPGMAS